MRTFIFIPALPRMTGGLAVLKRLADSLAAASFPVVFTHFGAFPPGFEPDAIQCMYLNEALPEGRDIWFVPEGFSNALAPGLRARARCVAYVQNWAYLLSSMPADIRWQQLPVHFLAVSLPVAWFTEWVSGKKPELLRAGIDRTLFFPSPERRAQAERGFPDVVRIAWMPRKNKGLTQQIRTVLESRLPENFPGLRLEWVEIHTMTQLQVADTLRSCPIFFSSGFPEGLSLPPLEALGCGALVAGFSGMGGFDYMHQIPHVGAFEPWWPTRRDCTPPNGFYAADGDIPRAVICLEEAVTLVRAGGLPALQAFEAGQVTAEAYSLAHFEAAARALWERAAVEELWVNA